MEENPKQLEEMSLQALCCGKELVSKLFKQLFNEVPNMHQNIISGFEATGIHPLNLDKLLKEFPGKKHTPSKHPDNPTMITETLVEFLSQQRHPVQISSGCNTEKKARRRLTLTPGQSVASEDSPLKNNSATSIPVSKQSGSARKLFVSLETDTGFNTRRAAETALKEPPHSATLPKEMTLLVKFKQTKSVLYYVGHVMGR
ncbi:hypothetical protein ANN_26295 [Periplaneta americana]|uniref:Uncharacterized protein n=1 Tax=Periplaneta americana TaxID=6978 RepID=A0ABQ8S645_PERAM|nr:hypothetical protein ANN_26295 [Periplaneta americana]